MSEKEDKKSLSSIGVIKKTEKISPKEENLIGVEADIPVDSDEIVDVNNISEGLRVNDKSAGLVTDRSEVGETRLETKESQVQVFNISSGKVVKKNLYEDSRPPESNIISDDKIEKSNSNAPVLQRKAKSVVVTRQEEKNIPIKKIIVIIIILLLALLILLIFGKGFSSQQKEKDIPSPTIKLTN